MVILNLVPMVMAVSSVPVVVQVASGLIPRILLVVSISLISTRMLRGKALLSFDVATHPWTTKVSTTPPTRMVRSRSRSMVLTLLPIPLPRSKHWLAVPTSSLTSKCCLTTGQILLRHTLELVDNSKPASLASRSIISRSTMSVRIIRNRLIAVVTCSLRTSMGLLLRIYTTNLKVASADIDLVAPKVGLALVIIIRLRPMLPRMKLE